MLILGFCPLDFVIHMNVFCVHLCYLLVFQIVHVISPCCYATNKYDHVVALPKGFMHPGLTPQNLDLFNKLWLQFIKIKILIIATVFPQDSIKDKTRVYEKGIFEYHKIPYK